MKAHDALPTKRLIFSNIQNEETLQAFQAGVNPENSLLGRMGNKALESLGLTPESYRYAVVKGKVNLIIDVK